MNLGFYNCSETRNTFQIFFSDKTVATYSPAARVLSMYKSLSSFLSKPEQEEHFTSFTGPHSQTLSSVEENPENNFEISDNSLDISANQTETVFNISNTVATMLNPPIPPETDLLTSLTTKIRTPSDIDPAAFYNALTDKTAFLGKLKKFWYVDGNDIKTCKDQRSSDDKLIRSIQLLLNATEYADLQGNDLDTNLVKAEITTLLITTAFSEQLTYEKVSTAASSTSVKKSEVKTVATKPKSARNATEVAEKSKEYADILKILASFKSSIELMPAMKTELTAMAANSEKIDENTDNLVALTARVDTQDDKIESLEAAMASGTVATLGNITRVIETEEADRSRVNELKRRGIVMANRRKQQVIEDGILRIMVKSTSSFITQDLDSATRIHANIPPLLASIHVLHEKVRIFDIREGKRAASAADSYNPSFCVQVNFEGAESSDRPAIDVAKTPLAECILSNKATKREQMSICWRMPDEDQLAFRKLQEWKQDGKISSFLVNKNCRYTLYFSEYGADDQDFVNLPDPANVTMLTTATKENIKKAAGRNYFVNANGDLVKIGDDETGSDNW